jgi:hypothetical protein
LNEKKTVVTEVDKNELIRKKEVYDAIKKAKFNIVRKKILEKLRRLRKDPKEPVKKIKEVMQAAYDDIKMKKDKQQEFPDDEDIEAEVEAQQTTVDAIEETVEEIIVVEEPDEVIDTTETTNIDGSTTITETVETTVIVNGEKKITENVKVTVKPAPEPPKPPPNFNEGANVTPKPTGEGATTKPGSGEGAATKPTTKPETKPTKPETKPETKPAEPAKPTKPETKPAQPAKPTTPETKPAQPKPTGEGATTKPHTKPDGTNGETVTGSTAPKRPPRTPKQIEETNELKKVRAQAQEKAAYSRMYNEAKELAEGDDPEELEMYFGAIKSQFLDLEKRYKYAVKHKKRDRRAIGKEFDKMMITYKAAMRVQFDIEE